MIRLAITLGYLLYLLRRDGCQMGDLEGPRKGLEIAPRDSKSDGLRFVEVTWHRIFQGQIQSEYDSTLDCEEISIIHKEQRIPFGNDTIKRDFSKPEDRNMRYEYPSWRNAHLFRTICPRLKANWKEKWVIPRPPDACQSTKSFYEKRLLKKSGGVGE
jgi:hypothetical protein